MNCDTVDSLSQDFAGNWFPRIKTQLEERLSFNLKKHTRIICEALRKLDEHPGKGQHEI